MGPWRSSTLKCWAELPLGLRLWQYHQRWEMAQEHGWLAVNWLAVDWLAIDLLSSCFASDLSSTGVEE